MYKPQLDHKAKHGGYRQKPSKGQVSSLMALYQGISEVEVKPRPVKKQVFVQLKLEL